MERYRNFVRMEQLKEALREGNRDEALELADGIDQSRIKKRQDLNALAEVFLTNGMLVKAKDCLAEIYSRGSSKSVLMKLINLCLKLKEAEEAEKYYQEFRQLAPKDYYNYIYRYSIDKLESRPYPQLIETLEKLKKAEYIDVWAYELAKLYHKTGDEQKCISECNDIAIWFGEGEYVDKAKALIKYYTGELDINEVKKEISRSSEEASENGSDVAETDSDEAYGADACVAETDSDEAYGADACVAETDSDEAYGADVYDAESDDAESDKAAVEIGMNLKSEMWEPEKHDEPRGSLADILNEEEARRGLITSEEVHEESTTVDNDEKIFMEMIADEEVMLARAVMEELNKEEEIPERAWIDMSDYCFKAIEKKPIPRNGYIEAVLNKTERTLEDYFGFFACQDNMRDQIIKALELLLKSQIKNISLAVTGSRHSGKKTVIRGIVKMLTEAGLLSSTTSAVADGFKVNSMKLDEKCEFLKGKCFVIDRAGQLTNDAAAKLLCFNEQMDGKTAVIICDTRAEINKLFRNNRDINGMFPVRIHIPEFDKDDLAEMAAYEFKKGGYLIEEEAWEMVKKETVKLIKLSKDGSLKATGELARAAIDTFETRIARMYIEKTLAGEQTVRENVITVEDVEAVIRK